MHTDSPTAEKASAKELCITDNAGETCVTRTQLDALIAGAAGAASTAGGDTSTGGVTSGTGQASSTAPTISINGNNPATINVGETFGDLGAIITGPTTADTNLGIHTFLDGVAMDTVQLDTSVAGTHTIDYVAANSFGAATSTRTVIIEAPASATATSTPTTDTDTTTATSTVAPTNP